MRSLYAFMGSLIVLLSPQLVLSQGSLVGLNTDGALLSIALRTGALTNRAEEIFGGFSLGALARRGNNVFYVAVPSGETERALFKANIKTGVITHVDLNLVLDDDQCQALFFDNDVLYGVFFNSTEGTGGVYRINPRSGATRLIVDFSDLQVDPIGGAISRRGDFFYMLGKPNGDSSRRSLIRFKTRANTAQLFEVKNQNDEDVLCDRLKLNIARQNFVCLASPTSAQVDVCRLSAKGRATCVATLENVERIGGGHTMMTPDGLNYYALVYEPGDENSQRLIRFTSNGRVRSTKTINTIMIGARFGAEDVVPETNLTLKARMQR